MINDTRRNAITAPNLHADLKRIVGTSIAQGAKEFGCSFKLFADNHAKFFRCPMNRATANASG
jgi:hypothetical protein